MPHVGRHCAGGYGLCSVRRWVPPTRPFQLLDAGVCGLGPGVGHPGAPDYVDALVRAARQDVGADFVIATGQSHSIAEFAAVALAGVGIADGHEWVESDPHLVRPVDAIELVGDASKAQRELGWRPAIDFADLVAAMVDHDLALLTP